MPRHVTTNSPPKGVVKYRKTVPSSSTVSSSYINDLKLIKLDNEIVGRPNVESLHFSKTKYPITGSRCFVLTMFTEYTNNLDLAYENKYEFLKNEMKVGEI